MSVIDELLKRFKFTFRPRKVDTPDISVVTPAKTVIEDYTFPVSTEGRGTLVERLPVTDAPIANPGPMTADEFVEKLDLPAPPKPKRTRKPKPVVEGAEAEAPKPKRTRKPKPATEPEIATPTEEPTQ